MKNRIKRFYEEHKEEVVIGVAAVAVAALVVRKRAVDVAAVDLWHNRTGDQMIGVYLTNGTEKNFIQRAEQEAA